MSETRNDHLMFEPKPWTKATLQQWSIGEGELAERQELEETLLEKQKLWRSKALENLKADCAFYQRLLANKEVEKYLWNAVKEATLEALSGILHRYSLEDVEEGVSKLLLTPNDKQTWLYGRMEEETESIYSFINLMRGRELPEDSYIGKITDVTLQIVEDESDRNYGKKLFIFEVEIAEGLFTGKVAKIPLIISPYFLDFRMAGETEEQKQERNLEHYSRLLETYRNLGVVITSSQSAIISQIARVVGNTIMFGVDRKGTRASINKLIERAKSFDQMLSYNDLPDGNNLPL